jgi:hypothetical protein
VDDDDPPPEPEGGGGEPAEPPEPPEPEGGGGEPAEPPEPLGAVVELAPESPLGPDPEFDPAIVEDVAPIDDVVVVALAGPLAPSGVDGSAARTGEIATSPTTHAASGNRNRRCMPAS